MKQNLIEVQPSFSLSWAWHSSAPAFFHIFSKIKTRNKLNEWKFQQYIWNFVTYFIKIYTYNVIYERNETFIRQLVFTTYLGYYIRQLDYLRHFQISISIASHSCKLRLFFCKAEPQPQLQLNWADIALISANTPTPTPPPPRTPPDLTQLQQEIS